MIIYTMSGCRLFQLLICFLTVSREVIEVNWWAWLRSDVWSALIVLSITLSDHSTCHFAISSGMDDINWFVDSMSHGLLALLMWPMLYKVYFSCHFMWSSLICPYSDVLVLTVVHFVITWGLVFLRCLSVCYIICDYHWPWSSSIAVIGWYANGLNSWYQTFHDVRLLMLTSLLPHFWVSCHLVDWLSLYPFNSMMVVSVVDCTICTSSSVALTCVLC
jgi:hypothetical protein